MHHSHIFVLFFYESTDSAMLALVMVLQLH